MHIYVYIVTVPENTGWLNSQAFLSDFFIRPPQSYFGSLITSYFIGMYNSYFFDDQLKGTRDEIIGNIEWAQSVYPVSKLNKNNLCIYTLTQQI